MILSRVWGSGLTGLLQPMLEDSSGILNQRCWRDGTLSARSRLSSAPTRTSIPRGENRTCWPNLTSRSFAISSGYGIVCCPCGTPRLGNPALLDCQSQGQPKRRIVYVIVADMRPLPRPQYVVLPKNEPGFSIDDQYYVGASGLLVKPITVAGVTESTVYIGEDQVRSGLPRVHIGAWLIPS